MTPRRRTTVTRCALGVLALGLTLAGAGGGTVFAAGAPGDLPGLTGTPASESPPAANPPANPPPASEVVSPAVEAPIPDATVPAGPAPAAENPPPAAPNPYGNLFPDDGSPPPDVTNISLTGEAYVVRQDLKAPVDVHRGRYPRATLEVSKDLTTAFGAFADPGAFGRPLLAAAGGAGAAAPPAPTWAECVFPKSPMTPTEEVLGPGQGTGPTAAARCFQGAGQAGGYASADTGADQGTGVEVFSPAAALATVDAASNAVGQTITQSVSTLENVVLAGRVTIASLTNSVIVRTNGRPGGAVVETSATIGGLSVEGVPVALPSDALALAAPALQALPPVLSPLGALTFDVVPEQKEVSADGTVGAGRAAQLLVTVKNGQGTVSFGLGYASARGRTILNEFKVQGGPIVRPPRAVPGASGPLRYGSPTASGFVNSVGSTLGSRAPARAAAPAGASRRPGGFGSGGLPTAGLNLLPPLPGQNQGQNVGRSEAYGGDGPWLALIGGSLIGLVLARYLAYTMVRPAPA